MWTIAGEDATLNFEFTFGDQFVVPESGSIKVTVRDNEGVAIEDWLRKVLPDVLTTNISLVIPAAVNNLPIDQDFATRYVRLEYTYDGKPLGKHISYRITPFLPIQASPEGVQSRLGATETELPANTIDIHEAYYKLLPQYKTTLEAALVANDASCIAANNAIEIKAALGLMPGLSAKILQSETQENAGFVRMKVNFDRLRELLEAQLQTELTMMEEIVSGLIIADEGGTLMLLTVPTNVITG